ncbi:MAG TPA: maleylpyruvate isomerase N-terminal domain-containing protein [Streptosporangiaceae bacterium]
MTTASADQAGRLALLRTSLEHSYETIESICARLDDAGWASQSLCPDWSARGVVTHLGMMETVMTGWLPADGAASPPLDRIEPFLAQTDSLDNAAFADLIAAAFAARRRDLSALRPADLDRPSWTPIGPRTYGQFLGMRIFDFWVHERDITTPLRWPTDDGGPRGEIALAEVESALGYIVGKKVGLPDGASIVFHLTGPISKDVAVVVDGRAKVVDHVDRADVVLQTDLVTFMQLACGRIDPQAQIDAGTVTWTGNAEYGERAARNLRFTI